MYIKKGATRELTRTHYTQLRWCINTGVTTCCNRRTRIRKERGCLRKHIEDDLDRDPLDTDFEEEKPTASVTHLRETAQNLLESVSKSTVNQVTTGGAT